VKLVHRREIRRSQRRDILARPGEPSISFLASPREIQPPLGLHLLMGETARRTFENNIRNLAERGFVVVQAVAARP
jgi:hypothetical protein